MPNIFPPLQMQSPTALVQPQDQAPSPSVLGSVSAPSNADLALNGANAKLQSDTPQQYHYGAHGVLGNVGHVLERFGNIAGDILDPGATALIPGSDLFKQRQVAQDHALVQQAEENKAVEQKEQDTVANEGANREQKGDIESSKEDVATAKTNAALAGHGFKLDSEKGIVPLSYEELSPTQQAVHDLKQSQSDQADATAQLRAAQAANAPEQIKLAQQKLASIAQAHSLIAERLGLSRDIFNMHAYGTGPDGKALPGAMMDDNNNPIGTAVQGNVKPTTQARDAATRAGIGEDLEGRIRQQLKDPAIRTQIGPLLGRAKNFQEFVGNLPPELSQFGNDLTSYAAFQAGMHPVRGIGALQYFDKVVGGLGQTPEQLEGKLNSGHAVAEDVKNAGKPKTAGSKEAGSPGKADYVFQNGKLVKQ